jgi:quercetin dioxygenase-like cupin family protein
MYAGQTIENPVTGERLVFHETARETGGEYTRFEAFVAPGGHVPAPHLHPKQTETFEIVSGTLGLKLGRETRIAHAGDVVVIEPGVPHDFWNAGEETVQFKVEVRPALGIEPLLETMYALAADGKTRFFGMPNPLRLAVIANEHFDTVRLPVVPAFLQRAALAAGAPLGRLLGFQPSYTRKPPVAFGAPALA